MCDIATYAHYQRTTDKLCYWLIVLFHTSGLANLMSCCSKKSEHAVWKAHQERGRRTTKPSNRRGPNPVPVRGSERFRLIWLRFGELVLPCAKGTVFVGSKSRLGPPHAAKNPKPAKWQIGGFFVCVCCLFLSFICLSFTAFLSLASWLAQRFSSITFGGVAERTS